MLNILRICIGQVKEYNGERTLEGLSKFLETDGVYGEAAPDDDEDDDEDDDDEEVGAALNAFMLPRQNSCFGMLSM